MVILRHKFNNPVAKVHIECACGCIFEFYSDDPAIHFQHKVPYVVCPECGQMFRLRKLFY